MGEAVITTAGNLPAKFVIHAVGPVWNDGKNNEEQLLYLAYFNSLKLAIEHRVRTISFPNISTGIYRFPKDRAALIAINASQDFLKTLGSFKLTVIFVCFDLENFHLYTRLLS